MDSITPIAQALVGQLWWQFEAKTKKGEIPLDSARMINAFFSHSIYDKSELPKKYEQVLEVARSLNHNYKWEVVYEDALEDETSKVVGPWKVWLKFEKIESPEIQE